MHKVNLNDQNPLWIQPHQSTISVSNSPIFQFYASSVKIIITIICKLRTNKKKSVGIKCLNNDQPNNIFNTHTHTQKLDYENNRNIDKSYPNLSLN